MTTRRLFVLEVLLLGGLGAVFFVPKTNELQAPGIVVALPDFVGEWYGTPVEVSKGERDILGPDTEFARRLYTNGQGGQVFVSIVLSGPDMNTSIHRPERCLPAQGWTIAHSDTVSVPVAGRSLGITRLLDMRPMQGAKGQAHRDLFNLTYYWFVGRNETTPSHLYRTYVDIRDRLFKGYNQRWAYVTVAATITKGVIPFGRTEKETDVEVQGFIKKLVPLLAKPPSSSSEKLGS